MKTHILIQEAINQYHNDLKNIQKEIYNLKYINVNSNSDILDNLYIMTIELATKIDTLEWVIKE